MPTTPRRLGWRPDYQDPRDVAMKFATSLVDSLPATNPRFPDFLPPIWDQGRLGSCTAHGVLRLASFAAAKAGLKPEMLSRLQLYYDERALEGTIKSDAGAQIRSGIRTLVKKGVALESLWKYDDDPSDHAPWEQRPPSSVYANALSHQGLRYDPVVPLQTQVKAALRSGFPVVFGFPVFESMFTSEVEHTGNVASPIGRRDKPVGGHCGVFNGFWDDTKQRIGWDGSWGDLWGDRGRGTLSYWYFQNGMISDCWVLYSIEGTAA